MCDKCIAMSIIHLPVQEVNFSDLFSIRNCSDGNVKLNTQITKINVNLLLGIVVQMRFIWFSFLSNWMWYKLKEIICGKFSKSNAMQTNIPHNKPKCSYLFSFLIFLFFLSLPDFNEVFVEKTFPLSHFLNAFVSLFFGIFLNKITEGRPKKCYNSPKLNFQIALYSSYYMLNCKNLLSMKMTFLK